MHKVPGARCPARFRRKLRIRGRGGELRLQSTGHALRIIQLGGVGDTVAVLVAIDPHVPVDGSVVVDVFLEVEGPVAVHIFAGIDDAVALVFAGIEDPVVVQILPLIEHAVPQVLRRVEDPVPVHILVDRVRIHGEREIHPKRLVEIGGTAQRNRSHRVDIEDRHDERSQHLRGLAGYVFFPVHVQDAAAQIETAGRSLHLSEESHTTGGKIHHHHAVNDVDVGHSALHHQRRRIRQLGQVLCRNGNRALIQRCSRVEGHKFERGVAHAQHMQSRTRLGHGQQFSRHGNPAQFAQARSARVDRHQHRVFRRLRTRHRDVQCTVEETDTTGLASCGERVDLEEISKVAQIEDPEAIRSGRHDGHVVEHAHVMSGADSGQMGLLHCPPGNREIEHIKIRSDQIGHVADHPHGRGGHPEGDIARSLQQVGVLPDFAFLAIGADNFDPYFSGEIGPRHAAGNPGQRFEIRFAKIPLATHTGTALGQKCVSFEHHPRTGNQREIAGFGGEDFATRYRSCTPRNGERHILERTDSYKQPKPGLPDARWVGYRDCADSGLGQGR